MKKYIKILVGLLFYPIKLISLFNNGFVNIFISDYLSEPIKLKNEIEIRIIKLGYPRVEILKKTFSNKILNYIFVKNFKKKKIIYYTPLRNNEVYDIPITKLSESDCQDLKTFLLKDDYLLAKKKFIENFINFFKPNTISIQKNDLLSYL